MYAAYQRCTGSAKCGMFTHTHNRMNDSVTDTKSHFICLIGLHNFSIEFPNAQADDTKRWPTLKQCISYYRGINILMNDFNIAFGKLVVPFVKLGLIIAFVLSFVTVVRLHKYLDVLSLAMISTLVWTSILDLFPTAIIMSRLYDASQKFSWNISENSRSNRIDRRILKMQTESEAGDRKWYRTA